MSYPVVWRDQTYTLGDLTVGVKKAFVEWARLYLCREGAKYIESAAERAAYRAAVVAGVWWADAGISPLGHDVMVGPDGARQLNRLLFGDSAKALADADLDALIAEKEADKASDYMVAMDLIREGADPKA